MTDFKDKNSVLAEKDEPSAADNRNAPDEVCFFGGDISFDVPETYDEMPDKRKTIRSVFSMLHFSAFVYMLASQGVATILMLLALFTVSANGLASISLNADFTLVLNAVSQYLIAFPIFFLLTKGIKKNNAEKKRLTAGEFLLIFLIAEGIMLSVANLTELVSRLTQRLFGIEKSGTLDSLLNDTSLWVVFISVCVLAPIFEELMFRKIMIDRLSSFGDGVAIVFSSVAFGFFHGNLEQIFYATAVGLVLGYTYTRTRKIHHTVLMHSLLNFIGGVLPLFVDRMSQKAEAMRTDAAAGADINTAMLGFCDSTVIAYGVLTGLFIAGGIAALILVIVKKKIKVAHSEEYEVKTVVKTGMANAGFILMYSLAFILALISLITL